MCWCNYFRLADAKDSNTEKKGGVLLSLQHKRYVLFYWISHYLYYYTIGQDTDFVQYFNSQTKCHLLSYWIRYWYSIIRSLYKFKYTVTYLYKVWNQFTSNKLNIKRSKLLIKYDRKDITLSLCYKIQKKYMDSTNWIV